MTHQVPSYRPAAAEEKTEEESLYRPGERITHRLFGGGAIVEVTGLGRDVKAIIDFDDQAVGRKTIKLAYTTLERGSP